MEPYVGPPAETYLPRIPDDAVVKCDDAVRSGRGVAERSLDRGGGRDARAFAVIAQWV
jgi:hypothetical protein